MRATPYDHLESGATQSLPARDSQRSAHTANRRQAETPPVSVSKPHAPPLEAEPSRCPHRTQPGRGYLMASMVWNQGELGRHRDRCQPQRHPKMSYRSEIIELCNCLSRSTCRFSPWLCPYSPWCSTWRTGARPRCLRTRPRADSSGVLSGPPRYAASDTAHSNRSSTTSCGPESGRRSMGSLRRDRSSPESTLWEPPQRHHS